MNGYKAFYRGKSIEVFADTSYKAQLEAARQFKAKRSFEVTVVLYEKQSEITPKYPVTEILQR